MLRKLYGAQVAPRSIDPPRPSSHYRTIVVSSPPPSGFLKSTSKVELLVFQTPRLSSNERLYGD